MQKAARPARLKLSDDSELCKFIQANTGMDNKPLLAAVNAKFATVRRARVRRTFRLAWLRPRGGRAGAGASTARPGRGDSCAPVR